MSNLSTDALFSGLMGFMGGLITTPINAIIGHFFKREELLFAYKLNVNAKKRELWYQHKLEMVNKDKEVMISELKSRIENLEKGLKNA